MGTEVQVLYGGRERYDGEGTAAHEIDLRSFHTVLVDVDAIEVPNFETYSAVLQN